MKVITLSILGVRAVTSEFSVFPLKQQEEILFTLFSVYNAVQRGKHTQIQSLLAHKLFVH